MREFDFTLKFRLADPQVDPNDYVDALYENGCDDGMVGIASKGRIALNFIREAATAQAEIVSAIADVKRAIPGIECIEGVSDFDRLT